MEQMEDLYRRKHEAELKAQYEAMSSNRAGRYEDTQPFEDMPRRYQVAEQLDRLVRNISMAEERICELEVRLNRVIRVSPEEVGERKNPDNRDRLTPLANDLSIANMTLENIQYKLVGILDRLEL